MKITKFLFPTKKFSNFDRTTINKHGFWTDWRWQLLTQKRKI